ncbi:MAG: prolyl aminopeptidase [Sphingosinicella sp.]|nr:prolyl aminopeptidase [Sphingosinicella sp.]
MEIPGLYPPIEPFRSGMLGVDALHSLYWEESGNPDGVPIVFLHGGPGGAGGPAVRRFYDPAHYRIIVFHQRGAGQSTPLGEVQQNTTVHLIGDMEQLRLHLSVERWIVAGGSWGSTLALAYAQMWPGRVVALLVNGVFLGRRIDIEWFLQAARDFFPEDWDRFVEHLPIAERTDLLAGYHARIFNEDADVAEPAVKAWAAYEGSLAALRKDPAVLGQFLDPGFALAYSRMNLHYFTNDCFLNGRPILENMQSLSRIPGIVVHGRYDLATPYRSAVRLVQDWPAARLVTVEAAGHTRYEAAIAAALVEASDSLRSVEVRA